MPLVFPPTTWFGDDRKALVKEIHINFESLKLDVSEHGAEVKRTWSALKVKECCGILRRVGFRLPRRHRPEPGLYNALTKKSALDENALRSMQKSFCFPYLTIEDMCYKNNLSLWLESRAKNAPASFAIFDLLQAGIPPFGHTSDPTDDMAGCAMTFPPHQPSKYGAVVHQDDLRNNDVGLPPDVGYAVLQLHKWLYEKPVRLIREILAFRGRLQARQTLHPGELCAKRYAINEMELDQSPFRCPASIDFKFIEDVISSKCHAKLSHLLHLRESPAHLNTCIQDWADNIAWTENKDGNRYKNHNTAVALMIMDSEEQAWYWHASEAKYAYLRRNEADRKSESRSLTFQQVRDHLRSALHTVCTRMAEGLPRAATFEPALEPVESSDWSSFETMYNFQPKRDASPVLRRLYQLFSRLCSDGDHHVISPYSFSQEIDRLLKQEPEAYNLMTPGLEQRFRDIASLLQLEHQMELWQPEASYALQMARQAQVKNGKSTALTRDWYSAIASYVESHPLEPGSEVLRCPLEAAESAEVLKKQQGSCNFVEAWWKALDSALGWCTGSAIRKTGKKLPAVFAELMLRATKLDFPWNWATLRPAGQATSKQGVAQSDLDGRFGEGEVVKEAPVHNTDSPAETQDDPIEETAALSGVVSTGLEKLSIKTGTDLRVKFASQS